MERSMILKLVLLICFIFVQPSLQSVDTHHQPQKGGALFNHTTSTESGSEYKNSKDIRVSFCYAFISACLVGLTGTVPLLILPSFNPDELKEGENAVKLNRLLSFAVGGLLGDVFLHLLPESWDHIQKSSPDGIISNWAIISNGLWVLVGLISFCMLEKLFPDQLVDEEDEKNTKVEKSNEQMNGYNCNENNNNNNVSKHETSNGITPDHNGYISKPTPLDVKKKSPKIKASGYLNLLANIIDNFTHGLAVGASYLVSVRVGMLTTLAILLHEIPHEVGDFAILLRAGFTRIQAVKLQLLTASGGVFGAIAAYAGQLAGEQVAWILPFTSGGFIYVALCTVVPDIVNKDTSPRESFIQILCLLLAVAIMHLVSFIG